MRAPAALSATAAGVIAGLSAAFAADTGFAPVDVRATPFAGLAIEPGSGVTYRGGLVLSSSDRNFGSWSGLDFADDGTLYSIADDGQWLRLRLVETDAGLTGIADAMMAPLIDDAGAPIHRKVQSDAEGLRFTIRDGVETALVSLEQKPDVRAFAGPDFSRSLPTHIPLPAAVARMSANLGLEAIAVAPVAGPLGGAILVIAERFLDKNGNHQGFILDGPDPGAFTLKRHDEFDVSDAAFMPNGDLLVLERKFTFTTGFAMRLVLIPGPRVLPGALLDGRTILEASSADGIDNMEGLAIRPGPDGGAVVDLISDDNHSFLERTILLEFAVIAPQPLLPRLRPADAAIQ